MSLTVTIVEDDSIVALDLKSNLEELGYRVLDIFHSGEALLESYKHNIAEFLLTDINLKGQIDGLDAAKIIQEQYGQAVIIISAYADEETIERAKHLQPYGYIIKPFKMRELQKTLEVAAYRFELEKTIERTRIQYERFFEDDLSGDFFADAKGFIIKCNKQFATLMHAENCEKVVGLYLPDFFIDHDLQEHFISQHKETARVSLLETQIWNLNKTKLLDVLCNLVADVRDSQLQGFHGYVLDISEQKQLQQQLLQSQKLEAVGRLAGGIAHDFNNVLTIISGYTSIMQDKLLCEETVFDEMEGIHEACRKASRLTKKLLAFSKSQVLKPELNSLNDLLRSNEQMLRRLVPEAIDLSFSYSKQNLTIKIDTSQFEQILLNLVANARDAILSHGKITIHCSVENIQGTKTLLSGQVPSGNYAVLEISDTGEGMNSANLDKIFEPFYTTKSAEKGSGLGLSIIYGILQQSQSHIDVQSIEQQGTKVLVYFPLLKDPVTKEHVAEDIEYKTGSERIMLVEDDAELKRLLAYILTKAGYEVLETKDVDDALQQFLQEDAGIDLVITDVIMPKMDGFTFISTLQEQRSNLKCLYISGYPEKILQERNLSFTDHNFIRKPFESKELLQTIRAILDS